MLCPMKLFLPIAILLFQTILCYANPPEYDLQIELLPDAKQMSVRGTMKIPPRPQSQNQIQFALSELIQNVDVQIVSPVADQKPEINKQLRSWARPGWGQNTWSVRPKKAVSPDTAVVLAFQYQYKGEKAGFVLSASQNCFFASGINTAWYPQYEEFPRTDDGIRLRGLRSTGKISFHLPQDWKVFFPGIRENIGDQTVFKIEDPIFFSFAAAKYVVSRLSSPLNVSLYQLHSRGKRMESYLSRTAQVLKILSAEFGDYPFPEFAIAEVPSEEANEAGFAGASVDSFMLSTTDFMNQEFNTAYYGHEIGHQWWGNLVRTEGPEARWLLSEAMAQYGSLRAVDVLDGASMAEQYRRKGYPGYIRDQSGFGYLMVAAAQLDVALTELPQDGSLSRWLADSKGFFVFDMLSREMGREKFSAALRSITEKYAGRRIHWKDFKKEIQKFSDQDIGWFFHQWFEQPGLADWTHNWKQANGKVSLQIVQKAPHFRVRVPVNIRGESQNLYQEFSVQGGQSSTEWDVPFQVKDVEINPRFEVLAWTDEYKKEATALAPYARASLEYNDGNMQKARELFEQGLRNLPSQDSYGVMFLMNYGFAHLLFDENDLEKSRKHIEAALRAPAQRAERLPWAYLLLAQIADKTKNSTLVCSSLQSLLKADQNAPQKTGAVEQSVDLARKHSCQEPITK